jgi:hypothetical protein
LHLLGFASYCVRFFVTFRARACSDPAVRANEACERENDGFFNPGVRGDGDEFVEGCKSAWNKALTGIVTFAKYRRILRQFVSTTRALRH